MSKSQDVEDVEAKILLNNLGIKRDPGNPVYYYNRAKNYLEMIDASKNTESEIQDYYTKA